MKSQAFYTLLIFLALAACSAFASTESFVAKRSPTKYASVQSDSRFLYTGNVPKILNPQDLELFVSKSMLTVRAKAWISNSQAEQYPADLLLYWDAVRAAFQNDSTR